MTASHKQIFDVAWPYTLSVATAFIIQTVDSTMVAPLGTKALAALAVTGPAGFIPIALTMGLITSVQKRVANGRDATEVHRALSAGLVLGVILPLPFSFIYFFFSKQIAGLFTSGETLEYAAQFLKIYSFSFVFVAMNQALNGYWIGALKSKTRLVVTLAITAVNVLGNLVLIPVIGVQGAAASSLAAMIVGFGLNLSLTRVLENYRWSKPRWSEIVDDVSIIFGVSLNQISLALALNAAIFVVGRISVEALAVANVIGVLSLPALYLGIGYGTASGSFITKSFSQNQRDEARLVGSKTLTQVIAMSGILAAGLFLFSGFIRGWFFKDAATYDLSRIPILLLCFLYLIDGVCCTLQRFHFVTGGVRFSFLTMGIVQWVLFLPMAFAGVTYFGMTYPIYLCWHLAQRLLVAAILYVVWLKRLAPKRHSS